MKNFVKNILSSSCKLKYRGMYAIKSGDKSGGFLVYIEERNIGDSLAFLFMPHPMEVMFLSKQEVERSVKYNTLDLVEKLPKNVYDVCLANFDYYAQKAGITCNIKT